MVISERTAIENCVDQFEAGGRPDALSPDALELFALEWHLSEIAEYAVQFSRPHEDTPDGRRGFGRGQ